MRFSPLFLAFAAIACSGATPDAVPPTTPAPNPNVAAGAPSSAPPAPPPAASLADPKTLPGLETLTLEGREKTLFADLIGQLYAPCASEAVSIHQCIAEKRPCTGCASAARLLGEKIHAGATVEEAREIYEKRFGNTVKPVDLADSPARGPANALVTIVVWSDFECPHCKRAMPYLDAVLEKHAANVRLVHKFYPLRQHPHAAAAARAAIAAQHQGRYWEMERVLFDHQDEQEDADLVRYAQDLHLDLKRFSADMGSERTKKVIERDHDEAERAGLTGTPFILINGREFDGALFHVGTDLDAWVELEIQLAQRK